MFIETLLSTMDHRTEGKDSNEVSLKNSGRIRRCIFRILQRLTGTLQNVLAPEFLEEIVVHFLKLDALLME